MINETMMCKAGVWNIIIIVRTAVWDDMTPAEFTGGCIASASATPSPQQYMERNVDNSLITYGT